MIVTVIDVIDEVPRMVNRSLAGEKREPPQCDGDTVTLLSGVVVVVAGSVVVVEVVDVVGGTVVVVVDVVVDTGSVVVAGWVVGEPPEPTEAPSQAAGLLHTKVEPPTGGAVTITWPEL